jgi:hypothetical protein
MTNARINKLLNDGRHQAIVKEIGGNRYLFGFERISRNSRKRKVKYMLPAPLNLSQLTSKKKANPCTDTESPTTE